MGALAVVTTRRNAVANTVALAGNCSGAARARGQPQTLDFDCWTRWAHFAVVRVCGKLDCDALGQRKVKFVVCGTIRMTRPGHDRRPDSNMGETISLDDYTTLPGKSGATHSIPYASQQPALVLPGARANLPVNLKATSTS